MNVKWKKILWISNHLPKSSYILRTIAGLYLLYIVYQIIEGLNEPDVTNPILIIIAAVFFFFAAIFCVASGGIGLHQREYREAHEEEEKQNINEEDKK